MLTSFARIFVGGLGVVVGLAPAYAERSTPAQPTVRRAIPVAQPPRAPVAPPRASVVTPDWATTLRNVDTLKKSDQLFRPRSQDMGFVDACVASGSRRSFGDALRLAVEQSLQSRVYPYNAYVREALYMPENAVQMATGLLSHPFCSVNEVSIAHMLGEDKNGVSYVPQPEVVAKMANFTRTLESARQRAVAGQPDARADFVKIFSVFMGCLAYGESLTTTGDPDNPVQKQTFDQRYADYIGGTPALQKAFGVVEGRPSPERPSGVIVSRDRNGAYFTLLNRLAINADLTEADRSAMSEALALSKEKIAPKLRDRLPREVTLESWTAEERDVLKKALGLLYEEWLSVGLYQFMPSSNGNIIPCVDTWNQTYRQPSCQIAKTEPHTARALLSPGQNFNAFCGVQKIVHAISTQVNTSSSLGTDRANHRAGRRAGEILLAPPAQRCVTLYGRGGRGRMYAHFGPLRNSVMNRKTPSGERIPDNMEALFDCVDSALPAAFRLRYQGGR